MIVVALFLVVLVARPSLACMSSGVCGGMGAPSPCYPSSLPTAYVAPPPPVSACATSGCSPGYQCGAYGCYQVMQQARARALGAGLIADSDGFDGTASNQIVVQSQPAGAVQQQSSPPRLLTRQRPDVDLVPLDPNAAFQQCCMERNLPDACVSKCTFSSYTKETLMSMYFRTDACPIEASAEIQFCAAQGLDHRDCCARNGVSTTIAGDKCLIFCDQRPGNVTVLDYSYISCYEKFDSMLRCFWQNAVSRWRK